MTPELMEKYFRVGDLLYFIPNSMYKEDLTEEDKQTLLKGSFEEVKEILNYDLITNKSFIYLLDIIHTTLLVRDGEIVDLEELKEEIRKEYPYFLELTPKLIDTYIKKGYRYIFAMKLEDIPEEELVVENADSVILNHVGLDGVVSKNGFLDLQDSLTMCVYFDENGNRVDLTPVLDVYNKRWNKE